MSAAAPKLVRLLGGRDAALIVMGGIIGSGIFMNPSVVARFVGSGFLVMAVWVAGGLIALLGAGIFAELAARRPADGGLYAYLRDAFHPALAFIFGWTLAARIAKRRNGCGRGDVRQLFCNVDELARLDCRSRRRCNRGVHGDQCAWRSHRHDDAKRVHGAQGPRHRGVCGHRPLCGSRRRRGGSDACAFAVRRDARRDRAGNGAGTLRLQRLANVELYDRRVTPAAENAAARLDRRRRRCRHPLPGGQCGLSARARHRRIGGDQYAGLAGRRNRVRSNRFADHGRRDRTFHARLS